MSALVSHATSTSTIHNMPCAVAVSATCPVLWPCVLRPHALTLSPVTSRALLAIHTARFTSQLQMMPCACRRRWSRAQAGMGS